MSTQYPILHDRPINLWKVVELKEELKRRKLMTKGLKQDLIKRLEEAIRKEMGILESEAIKGVSYEPEDMRKFVQPEDMHKLVHAQSHSDYAEMADDAGNNAMYSFSNRKVQDHVAGVIDDDPAEMDRGKVQEVIGGADTVVGVGEPAVFETFETNDVMNEVSVSHLASVDKALDNSEIETRNDKAKIESEDLKSPQIDVEDIVVRQIVLSDKARRRSEAKLEKEEGLNPLLMDAEYDVSDRGNQVFEVSPIVGFQVKSDSFSTDTVSKYELKELDDSLNADNIHLELEICKSEIVQPSSIEAPPPNDSSLQPLDDHIPHRNYGFVMKSSCVDVSKLDHYLSDDPVAEDILENKPIEFSINRNKLEDNIELPAEQPIARDESSDDVLRTELSLEKVETSAVERSGSDGFAEEMKLQVVDSKSPDIDSRRNTEGADGQQLLKINLDQSSADNSLDNALEMKNDDSVHIPDEVGEKIEFTNSVEVSGTFDAVEPDSFSTKFGSSEKKDEVAAFSEKRKSQDEALEYEGPPKRQRSWSFEGLNNPEQLGFRVLVSTTTVDSLHTTTLKPNLNRCDSIRSAESPKGRVVPPSSKAPTNSLRIDRFLRPFTLKAVKEQLAKTGNVCSFWMDHIKTHCYVTYSSVEEAIETRNAVYNLQWPPNGGRLLIAKFVDPEEVKLRIETPAESATTSVTTNPNGPLTQASIEPPPSAQQKSLRPETPSPIPENVDPPIVTLDDLFRKTRATPQIYYLPLAEEQFAAKFATRSRGSK